jgi:hypothetical protein
MGRDVKAVTYAALSELFSFAVCSFTSTLTLVTRPTQFAMNNLPKSVPAFILFAYAFWIRAAASFDSILTSNMGMSLPLLRPWLMNKILPLKFGSISLKIPLTIWFNQSFLGPGPIGGGVLEVILVIMIWSSFALFEMASSSSQILAKRRLSLFFLAFIFSSKSVILMFASFAPSPSGLPESAMPESVSIWIGLSTKKESELGGHRPLQTVVTQL